MSSANKLEQVLPDHPASRTGLFRFRAMYVVAGVFFLVHALLSVAFPPQSAYFDEGAFFLLGCLALRRSILQATRTSSAARQGWILVSVGIMIWVLATALSAQADVFHFNFSSIAQAVAFLYLCWGVLILAAVLAPGEEESYSLLFWLDVTQAIAAGCMLYLAIFGVLPFATRPVHPLTTDQIFRVYYIEHCSLAVLATIRLAISSRGTAERHLFRNLAVYLWLYAIASGIYDHFVGDTPGRAWLGSLIDLPFLVLTIGAGGVNPGASASHDDRPSLITGLLDNVRPSLLSLGLIAMSLWAATRNFEIGAAVILSTFFLYGLRFAILHGRLQQAQRELEAARDRLGELALQDGLTGIANRRCFDERLALEWNRARRSHRPLSLLLIDVDFFKALNDTYGHLVGDECLRQAAQTLRGVLSRPGDLLARYGGEEFVALLPETDNPGARSVAARLQQELRMTSPVPALDRQITVSIGVSTQEPGAAGDPQLLLRAADMALYQAKQNGRNRIEFLTLPTA